MLKCTMRLEGDDGKEVLATDEELTSATQLGALLRRDTQYVNLAFNALTSLAGLEVAVHLRNLNVSHNALTSLRGVEAFQQLRRLRCSSNNISDLSCLVRLPALEELWINDNQVEAPQVAHLAAIQALRVLVLHGNPCTNAPNYVHYVVKTIPWLSRLDMTVVDDALRQQSQHVDDRAFLSSAASDVSEISLMTSRSDVDTKSKVEQQVLVENLVTVPGPAAPVSSPTSQTNLVKPKKAKKTAEDFLRAFPIQDFIPSTDEPGDPHDEVLTDIKGVDVAASSVSAPENEQILTFEQESRSNNPPETATDSTTNGNALIRGDPAKPAETPAVSAIASAVLALPLFDGDSLISKKKKPQSSVPTAAKAAKKTSKQQFVVPTDPALSSFHQPEWVRSYPNSTVNAIHVRPDGSALAKWPNGSIAVSVDRERNGFRCYAAHKDGAIALSFDAIGVGFINYHPSGRMMVSTSSSGDGLYFSPDGSIARQWNAQLEMKNEKWEATSSLSDSEADGSLLSRLSDGLGIRLHVKPTDGSQRPSPIHLTIYFNSGSGIRHALCNWINKSEATGGECDEVFGKEQPKLKKNASESQLHSHHDMLSDIRAAVAKLG